MNTETKRELSAAIRDELQSRSLPHDARWIGIVLRCLGQGESIADCVGRIGWDWRGVEFRGVAKW